MDEVNEEIRWYHLAICKGMNDPRPGDDEHNHRDYFYEEYESDPVVAANMDTICLACPVQPMCLREGIENNEWGLWGGVFLINGKVDEARNAHKTEEVWQKIRERVGGVGE